MKKIAISSFLAIALAALVVPQAWAWKNTHLGIGLNWNHQSGGNNLLWGLFRNGQPPGPGCDGFQGGCFPGGAPAFPGYGAANAPQHGTAFNPPRNPSQTASYQTPYNPYRVANYYYPYPAYGTYFGYGR